ncbi:MULTISPECIES: hypothetical protein [Pasteurellaceae]|uniref:hypothetical protein n=1 Tax=Pasteurellaceae TaxID=712 RepID=UPI00059F3844|nr:MULTISPECIES: hypothetical protein [Pasteurellaceae]MDG2958856.1 hypothetical protein [Exercitatus varius]
MSDKLQTATSSLSNSPAAYAGAFASILTALIRMFVPTEYVENSLTISAAISPLLGVWVFERLNKRKRSDAQIAYEIHIKERMKFLEEQIASKGYTKEQKDKFYEEKMRLTLEYTQINKTVQ